MLLLNLGTPDATDYWSIRRYLKEFLSDERVIDLNPLLWKPLFNLVILTTRPSRSGRAYAAIWNREQDESPLRTITREQCARLTEALGRALPGHDLLIDWAMRYGNPVDGLGDPEDGRGGMHPAAAVRSVSTIRRGYDRDRLRPGVPGAVRGALAAGRAHRTALFRASLVHRGARALDRTASCRLSWQPDIVLASFHGLPERYLMLGDPYHCQCAKTTRLLRERLGWDEGVCA